MGDQPSRHRERNQQELIRAHRNSTSRQGYARGDAMGSRTTTREELQARAPALRRPRSQAGVLALKRTHTRRGVGAEIWLRLVHWTANRGWLLLRGQSSHMKRQNLVTDTA